MSKLGEVIFYDGHSEEILVVLHNWPTFVQVVTQNGIYSYSKVMLRIVHADHRFSAAVPKFNDYGYFTHYETVPMTNEIVMFRLYDPEKGDGHEKNFKEVMETSR